MKMKVHLPGQMVLASAWQYQDEISSGPISLLCGSVLASSKWCCTTSSTSILLCPYFCWRFSVCGLTLGSTVVMLCLHAWCMYYSNLDFEFWLLFFLFCWCCWHDLSSPCVIVFSQLGNGVDITALRYKEEIVQLLRQTLHIKNKETYSMAADVCSLLCGMSIHLLFFLVSRVLGYDTGE